MSPVLASGTAWRTLPGLGEADRPQRSLWMEEDRAGVGKPWWLEFPSRVLEGTATQKEGSLDLQTCQLRAHPKP